ncbi:hypothetical protein DPMN_074823 [Dreissena polymorpha]|uniref:Uncharacterized protein n=1 Tax=Dreissena polymorpha TaxID=45954 RepID=A0A9D3YGZ5_DREPO|nr:hypothetical protein DPMN_074823 [Dreissena polymorpha]
MIVKSDRKKRIETARLSLLLVSFKIDGTFDFDKGLQRLYNDSQCGLEQLRVGVKRELLLLRGVCLVMYPFMTILIIIPKIKLLTLLQRNSTVSRR